MSISQLSLTDFRNLKSTTLDFDPGFNLITGSNGSGKTSLLEAIYVLSQGHSFRSHQLVKCINHGSNGFLLFGKFEGFKAGLAKTGRKLEIHVNGETIKRRSELVRRAPINIVNSDSFQLVDGAPQKRRSFLDWCLFHVEPAYAESWAKFQHALKQRNRLLKTRQDLKLLDYWDQHLAEPSLQIAAMRREYSERLKLIIDDELSDVLKGLPFELEYQQGWPQAEELDKALKQGRAQDVRRGFTSAGIHRDELNFISDGKRATDTFSRGQTKRLCLTLFLAALKLVSKQKEEKVLLLIDDLNSELDIEAQNIVYRLLTEMNLQLFISNIDNSVPVPIEGKDFKMFHVEHGIIKPRIFS